MQTKRSFGLRYYILDDGRVFFTSPFLPGLTASVCSSTSFNDSFYDVPCKLCRKIGRHECNDFNTQFVKDRLRGLI